MDEFRESLNDIKLDEVYEEYLKVVALIEELNKNIKELPPKEEL